MLHQHGWHAGINWCNDIEFELQRQATHFHLTLLELQGTILTCISAQILAARPFLASVRQLQEVRLLTYLQGWARDVKARDVSLPRVRRCHFLSRRDTRASPEHVETKTTSLLTSLLKLALLTSVLRLTPLLTSVLELQGWDPLLASGPKLQE